MLRGVGWLATTFDSTKSDYVQEIPLLHPLKGNEGGRSKHFSTFIPGFHWCFVVIWQWRFSQWRLFLWRTIWQTIYLCIKKPVTRDDVVKDGYDLCFFDRNILAILGVSLRLLNKYIIYLFRTLFNRWKLGGGLCFLFKLVLCLVCNPNTFLLLWEPKGCSRPMPRKNHWFHWGCWLSPSSWRLPSKCWHLCMWPFFGNEKNNKNKSFKCEDGIVICTLFAHTSNIIKHIFNYVCLFLLEPCWPVQMEYQQGLV